MNLCEYDSHSLNITIESTRLKKSLIDFNSLGKTLAYSPFLPRVDRDFYKLDSTIKKIFYLKLDSNFLHNQDKFIQNIQKIQNNNDAYLLDLTHITSVNEHNLYLESISLLRRYSTLPIIYAGVFLEKYHILEAALFGADSLFLPVQSLSTKELKILLDFAYQLSFSVFVAINDVNGLKKAIFSGANMLFIPDLTIKNLLPLIPQSQIIFSDSKDDYGLDLCLCY